MEFICGTGHGEDLIQAEIMCNFSKILKLFHINIFKYYHFQLRRANEYIPLYEQVVKYTNVPSKFDHCVLEYTPL